MTARSGPLARGILAAVVVWTVGVLGRLPIFDWKPWVVALAAAASLWIVVPVSRASSRRSRLAEGASTGLVAGAVCALALAVTADFRSAWVWFPMLLVVSVVLGLAASVAPQQKPAIGRVRWLEKAPLSAAAFASLVLFALSNSAFVGRGLPSLQRLEGWVASMVWPLRASTDGFPAGAPAWLDSLAGLVMVVFLFVSWPLAQQRSRRKLVAALFVSTVALFVIESFSGGAFSRWVSWSADSGVDALSISGREWLYLATRPLFLICGFASVGWVLDSSFPSTTPRTRDKAASHDLALVLLLLGLLWAQAVLGGAQRWNPTLQVFHLLFGIAVVLPVLVHISIRGWLFGTGRRRRLAIVLGFSMAAQVTVGLAAFAAPRFVDWGAREGLYDLTLTTLHQGLAAALLAITSALVVDAAGSHWARR